MKIVGMFLMCLFSQLHVVVLSVESNFCYLQSDVDVDLVGDICDTGIDR